MFNKRITCFINNLYNELRHSAFLYFFFIKLNLQKKVLFSRTDFLPWEFLLIKKLEIQKTKTTFIICISFKSCMVGGLCFFKFQFFLLPKVLKEGNLFTKKGSYYCKFGFRTEVFRSFFGRIENKIICFWKYLTFN